MKTEKKDLFEETFDSLWKIENYNFGTTDEDGYHNFDDYTEYPFAIEEMSTLNNEYQKLKQQLKTYKQKEEKLREMFKSEKLENLNKYYYGDSYELDAHELRKDILQILNEGDK